MTDREKVIESFESSIESSSILSESLIEQYIFNATIDFAYEVEGAGGKDLLEYTKGTFTTEGTLDVSTGVFSRGMSNLEIRIIGLFSKKTYLQQKINGMAKQIGYASKNLTTKDLKSAKDAMRQEMVDCYLDIDRLMSFIINGVEYSV